MGFTGTGCLDALQCLFALNLIVFTYHVHLFRGDLFAVGYTPLRLCLHSMCNIHWDSCLPHLPAIGAHQAVEEGV